MSSTRRDFIKANAVATAVAAACVGAVLLIAPRGLPGRILGVIWLLPLLLFPVPRPEHGDYWLTLLDVGQGLSAVVDRKSTRLNSSHRSTSYAGFRLQKKNEK